MRDLQLCSSDPADLDAARAALGTVDNLRGMHHRVTVSSYSRSRRPQIRTLPVVTDHAGHIDVRATAGTYRYLIVGDGTVELHVTSAAGTLIDIVEPCQVTVNAADHTAVDINVYAGTLTLTAADTATGLVAVARTADCIARSTGGMTIRRQSRFGALVIVPPELTSELCARARAQHQGVHHRSGQDPS